MKAMVCVKRVIDYAVKVRVAKNNSGVDLQNGGAGVGLILTPKSRILVENIDSWRGRGIMSRCAQSNFIAESFQN